MMTMTMSMSEMQLIAAEAAGQHWLMMQLLEALVCKDHDKGTAVIR
jgi:hypothetical protein